MNQQSKPPCRIQCGNDPDAECKTCEWRNESKPFMDRSGVEWRMAYRRRVDNSFFYNEWRSHRYEYQYLVDAYDAFIINWFTRWGRYRPNAWLQFRRA